jgi:hypothetical protein
VTEAELQQAVIELARLLGYRVAHFRAAQTVKGWRTPVEADGKGFPDLVCVKPGRLLFIELKSERGRLSVDQQAWLGALIGARAHVVVLTPHDWLSGAIEAVLRA